MNAFDSIYANNINLLKEYLETGDINVINERGMSLLHYAIVFNNSEVLNLLLDNYINVNIQDKHGETAAHYCVINNRMGFLKTLIRHNCDLNIKNEDGQNALYKACVLGRDQMISLFLETMEFDLNDVDSNNLMIALLEDDLEFWRSTVLSLDRTSEPINQCIEDSGCAKYIDGKK